MKENREKENREITDAIQFFKHGKFSERKIYLKGLLNGGVQYGNYVFQKDSWCWLVWKSTNLADNPEFKGEPLVKVIPDTVPVASIPAVLDAQPWTYI